MLSNLSNVEVKSKNWYLVLKGFFCSIRGPIGVQATSGGWLIGVHVLGEGPESVMDFLSSKRGSIGVHYPGHEPECLIACSSS